jgi:cyclophilin family peptidyl-prolyl cis-trans isomerase
MFFVIGIIAALVKPSGDDKTVVVASRRNSDGQSTNVDRAAPKLPVGNDVLADHSSIATAEFVHLVLGGDKGSITLKLLPDAAPKTVANFKALVSSGWYNGTTLYRYEAGFCLQGGGWPTKSSPLPVVPLEYKLPNAKFAVSMARTGDPNSATSEFSIMLGDNSKWLGPGGSDKYGYAVFAHVVGLESANTIRLLGGLPTKKAGLTLFVDPVKVEQAYLRVAPDTERLLTS